ncbi:MAG TPA: hypothetical protein VFE06_07635 [Acidobacteriaceae bacterium]|nr:hypothetical protein [Acidobacteriaceae bacterium]
MQRRAQLALALALLLVLAPLASASCGIQCLTATSPLPTHAAASPQHCVRASACCHSTGPAVCSAIPAPEAIAALLSASSGTADPATIASVVAGSLPQGSTIRTAHRIDSAPPGPPDSASPIPLRI